MKTWGDFTRPVEKVKGNEWLDLVRQDVALKHKTNDEYCSPCPVCGGDDRFVVWADKGKFWCRGCEKQGDAIDYLTWSRGLDFNQARDLLFPGNGNAIRTTTTLKPSDTIQPTSKTLPKPQASKTKEQGIFEKSYFYDDRHDQPYFREDVKRRSDGTKYCPVFLYDSPTGTWKSGVPKGTQLFLYKISSLSDATQIDIGEGPKCCDALISIDRTATTNPFGAGSWKVVCKDGIPPQELHGKDIIVHEDNDESGRTHALDIAKSLHGYARSIKIITYRNQRPKYDVANLIQELGHEQAKAAIKSLIDATPEYKAEPDSHPQDEITEPPSNNSTFNISKLISFNQLEQMEIEPPQMIVERLQPEGLTLLVGPMKLGKTQLESQKALAIANGTKFLGKFDVVQGTVLFLALEDSYARFRDRIICQSQGRPCPGNAFIHNVWPKISRSKGKKELCGLDLIQSWIELHHDTAMHITIDTLQKLRPGSRGQGQTIYEKDYDDLGDLQRLAIDARIGITVVHHTNKMSSSDELDQISGSNALGGACDTIVKLSGQRGSNEAEMFCTGRDIPEFRGVIRRDPDSKTWQWVGESGEIKLTEARQEIWDAIKDAGKPLTITDLASALGKQYRSVQSTVMRMKAKGELLPAIQNRWQLPSPDAMEGI